MMMHEEPTYKDYVKPELVEEFEKMKTSAVWMRY